jgi:hypothetical protein
MAPERILDCEHSVQVAAPPGRVLASFFDPAALAAWLQVKRSVTVPRPLGIYALEWEPTAQRDYLLGPLGGVFYGLVTEFAGEKEFFVADAYWLPPEGEPIGPMGLEVRCVWKSGRTHVTLRQSGFDDGPRWSRYFDLVGPGWLRSLEALRDYLER